MPPNNKLNTPSSNQVENQNFEDIISPESIISRVWIIFHILLYNLNNIANPLLQRQARAVQKRLVEEIHSSQNAQDADTPEHHFFKQMVYYYNTSQVDWTKDISSLKKAIATYLTEQTTTSLPKSSINKLVEKVGDLFVNYC
jgi:hypothetical protein